MGLFKPKVTKLQLETVKLTIKQLKESTGLVNTTTKPDVFFKRLNFSIDLLMELQHYEKLKIFKQSTPTKDLNKLLSNIELTVDDFITRAVELQQQKLAGLKTEKGRQSNAEKFATQLIAAFDSANSFWQGNSNFPHYTGPLFTDKNYQRVLTITNQI